MVGLPARGKTYIAQKVCRYLTWTGTSCRVFNVGEYRRKNAGANCTSSFFDPNNRQAVLVRNESATAALEDMVKWFHDSSGEVAIYDATNTTQERRKRVYAVCQANDIEVMFIESICHDPEVIIHNIAEVKLSGPDYAGTFVYFCNHLLYVGIDPDAATLDFKERMRHYESAYETIAEDNLSFIKLINVGSLVIVNLIKGWLQSRIVYFLLNLHTQPRRILFSRHGESMYNLKGLLGGDADLSPRGQLYAQSLPSAIRRALGSDQEPLTVWTSTLKRTKQTAAYLDFPKLAWKALDELDAGVCDGMTYEEIEAKYPEDYMERDADKYRYRYRGGESYFDLVTRLEPIIMELERQRNILIIGHQAVLRCLYAYFMKILLDDLPYTKIPLHTVISITPRAHGCDEERYSLDISAVDTHRDPRRGSNGTKTPPQGKRVSVPSSPTGALAERLGDQNNNASSSPKEEAASAETDQQQLATFEDTSLDTKADQASELPISISTKSYSTTQFGPFLPSPETPMSTSISPKNSFDHTPDHSRLVRSKSIDIGAMRSAGGLPRSKYMDVDGIKVTFVEAEPVNNKPSIKEEAEKIIGGEPMQ